MKNQCSTCGETSEDKLIMQCTDCDGERYYYQLQRWREAALVAEAELVAYGEPRWWQRLLGRRAAKVPAKVAEAVRGARALEEERR